MSIYLSGVRSRSCWHDFEQPRKWHLRPLFTITHVSAQSLLGCVNLWARNCVKTRPRPERARRRDSRNSFGTHDQCRSQKFQKTVRYLSEICQKTVSYKNQSENSKKCVRYKSENCQLQISVRTLLENIWNCIRNVSDFINESENCHWFICKTIRILSEISLLTDFRHIYN